MNNDTATPRKVIALDIGEKRIGVAHADTAVRLPVVHSTIVVGEQLIVQLEQVVQELQPDLIVIGYPRNQQGEATRQTRIVEDVTEDIRQLKVPVAFQDESLTSVMAENFLKKQKKPYTKADIDAHAAAIILGDYLEENYGR